MPPKVMCSHMAQPSNDNAPGNSSVMQTSTSANPVPPDLDPDLSLDPDPNDSNASSMCNTPVPDMGAPALDLLITSGALNMSSSPPSLEEHVFNMELRFNEKFDGINDRFNKLERLIMDMSTTLDMLMQKVLNEKSQASLNSAEVANVLRPSQNNSNVPPHIQPSAKGKAPEVARPATSFPRTNPQHDLVNSSGAASGVVTLMKPSMSRFENQVGRNQELPHVRPTSVVNVSDKSLEITKPLDPPEKEGQIRKAPQSTKSPASLDRPIGAIFECLIGSKSIRKCWVRANRALRGLGGPKAPRGLRAQGDKP